MTDRETKRSRCFGFVKYSTSQERADCLGDKPHVVDGKKVRREREEERGEGETRRGGIDGVSTCFW